MGRQYEPKDGDTFDDYEKDILSQIAHVFDVTTYEQRFKQLNIWTSGEHNFAYLFCLDLEVSKIALLMAAMFETAYPLLFDENRDIKKTVTGCAVAILDVELQKIKAPGPPDPDIKMIFTWNK